MSPKKRSVSGLDKFLRESMAEDKKFRALFLAEAKKLPKLSRTRVLKDLRKNP
jgi:hypothetical protein